MKKIVLISILLLNSNFAAAEESPILYKCTVEAEIVDEESRVNPRYEPNIRHGYSSGSRSLRGAVIGAFKNGKLDSICEVDANINQVSEDEYDGHWNVFDRDEKFLTATCAYRCEDHSL